VGEVFEGSPAFKAGLRRGDEIVTVNGQPFEPVYSIKSLKTGVKATFNIKRTPWDKPTSIKVGTVVESLEESMLRATKLSVQIKRVGNKDFGYIRLWDSSNEEIREILKHVTKKFEGKTSAMLLDLRGGIGVSIEGLETIFTPGKGQIYKGPLFVLTNRFTADGKERLAHLLQINANAQIIGERPMGAILSGKIITLEPRSSLAFFPDRDSTERLTPNIRVKDTLVYTAGHDNLLWEALKIASK
jgi:carboxyl-terminal processing protease